MKTLSLIVLVLSFAITTPATAKDKDGLYWILGARSCGEWVKDRKEGGWIETANMAWIVGYISAYNQQTPDVFNILGSTGLEGIYFWMDKYCQENPLDGVSYGMDVLVIELWPNRKRTADD